ncbi:MAG: hypothetical protein E7420_00600 [Ruminococcaceae bacterium]|nr:hypothetical protein [Oscillospiraceae bacterium]
MEGRKGKKIKTSVYQKFRGADFSTDPALVDKTRSPFCTNMVSDGGGMPEKRCGWRTLADFGERINGLFSAVYKGESIFYVHSGNTLYLWDRKSGEKRALAQNLCDSKSRGRSLGGKFWIVTGREFLCCEGEKVSFVRDMGYIPTTVITRQSDGGGAVHEAINLLSPYRRNGFQTDGETKTFLLDSDCIDTELVLSEAIGEGEILFFADGGLFWCFETPWGVKAGESIKLDFENAKVYAGDAEADMEKCSESRGRDILSAAEFSPFSQVTAEVWGELVEDFTVNRAEGTISFAEAPAAPGAGNADGLTVTFPKTVAGYADMADGCRIISTFGVGSSDRIVLSGNPSYPARDWISAMGDPTYFPDLGYSVVGLEDVPIVGYCRVGERQAIVKKDNGQDASVFFRSAELSSEGEARFPLKQAVSGVGGVSEGGFANLLDEPLFVSGTGIFALSANYLTGDRVGQNRSYYINSGLIGEELSESEAVSWRGMYLLAFPNGHVYVLDGRQSKTYRSESLGDFVYEAYYWEGIPARCWLNFESEGKENLFFGTADGRVCRFNTDIESLERFSDDGAPIDSVWATKMDDDGCATVLKTMLKRGCAVTLKPYSRSSAQVYFRTDSDPGPRIAAETTLDIFSWENIDFERLSFDSNDSARELFLNSKVKKYKRLQIMVRNCVADEGFGVFAITKNYVEGNYAKR